MKTAISFCLLAFSIFGMMEAKSQLSIFAGPQTTNAHYTIRDVKQTTEGKQGFSAGVGLLTLIEGPAYFSPMLSFSRKGYKASFDRPAFPPDSAALNNDASINTIELAPLIQFNFSKKQSHLFIRLGPAFDFNLSGKERYDTAINKTVNRPMKFSFGDYSYATISMIGHLGYQNKSGFTVFAHYAYGVSSLNNADFGPVIFHRIAGVSLGWRLGKKNN